MAPKELEKVLYFAASIVTWVDDEARADGPAELEKRGQRGPRRLRRRAGGARPRAAESLDAPRGVPRDRRARPDFYDEDHLWADALDINVKKLDDDEREKLLKDLRKTFEADIADTEAYIEDAAERMRQVWELFKDDEAQATSSTTRRSSASSRTASARPYGFGEYFRGGMGAEAIRDLLEQVDLDAERRASSRTRSRRPRARSRPARSSA